MDYRVHKRFPSELQGPEVGIIPISFNNFGSICEKNAVPTYLPTYQMFSTYLLNAHEKSYEKTKKNPQVNESVAQRILIY